MEAHNHERHVSRQAFYNHKDDDYAGPGSTFTCLLGLLWPTTDEAVLFYNHLIIHRGAAARCPLPGGFTESPQPKTCPLHVP